MQSIGRANRQKICDRYTWPRIVEAYERRCYLPAVTGAAPQDEAQQTEARP
jgi:hypothetical protein